MKDCEDKQNQDDMESESDVEEKPKPKKKKPKAKAPAKPRIKPSFYYVSSSEDEAGMLKDRFWKDLEDGKVDIFRTADLYSTVKAIGRSARPKSLAESDLRRSGLRSASNQLSERDQAVEVSKGKSKGKKGKKGAGKAGAERNLRSLTPKSRSSTVSVNLGVKVDHDLSSGVRGNTSSDDEDEVASTSTRSSIRGEPETKPKKKKRKKKEGKMEEEDKERAEGDGQKKTKRKSLKVGKAKKTKDDEVEESDVEDNEDDEEENVSVERVKDEDAGDEKKQDKMKKLNDKGDDDEEEEEEDFEQGADDGKRKKKEGAKPKKKKSVARKDDEDDDDDNGEGVAGDGVDDDEEGEDEDDDAGKGKKRKKRKADILVSKPNKKKKLEPDENKEEEEEEEDDEAEEVPRMNPEKKSKTKVQGAEYDPAMVRQHMEEAIDRVIAQSAVMWKERHGEEEGIQAHEKEDALDNYSRTSEVEAPVRVTVSMPKEKAGKKKKKRKEQEEGDENDDDDGEAIGHASSSKPRKSTDSVIDYYFSEEDIEYESDESRAKLSKKEKNVTNQTKNKNKESVGNSSGTMATDGDVAEARGTEEECQAERDLEEQGPDSLNDGKAKPMGEDEEHSKKDLHASETIASSGAEARHSETGDHRPDQKEEPDNGEPVHEDNAAADREPAETGDVTVEAASLDHLVFNLTTVEFVDPSEEIDSYAEWNIKVLTNDDLCKAVKFNDFSLVEAMMREAQQFDLEQVDPITGLTLTMVATQNYSMEIVEMLVLNGANVNARAKDGHSALTLACDKGLHCAVSLLLCLGANIGFQLPTGENALILAVKRNHFYVAQVLLDHGVNIGASGVGERHALSLARQLSHQPIVELLTAHKSRLTSELFQQVSMALEGSAKLGSLVFPIQCFRLCDGNRFRVDFRHELQPTQTSRGMLLFLGHGRGSAPDMQVRLFGTCAVTKAVLNNVTLQSLNEDNFILTFCPLRDGHNQLEIFTLPLSRNTYKVHLTVAAFVVTLV